MKLVSFRAGGEDSGREERFGAVRGERIADLTGHCGHSTLRGALQSGAESLKLAAHTTQTAFDLTDVSLLLPIPDPRMILCVGMNYRGPAAHLQDASPPPQYPSLFLRLPDSFAAHGEGVIRPRASEQMDFEGEIVLVIGKEGRHVSEAEALDYVFGITLANEGSVRDWMKHSKVNAAQGKNFLRSGAIGPWIVSSDAVDLNEPLGLASRVNGEPRQNDTTANMIFSFRFLISYISQFTLLTPGDMILTGAPVGARSDSPRWLVAGDVVEVSSPQIGTLRNAVVEESIHHGTTETRRETQPRELEPH